jgi:hypothetical protein
MKSILRWVTAALFLAGTNLASLPAQAPASPASPSDPANAPAPPPASLSSALLEWTPPVLAQLSSQAQTKESFTFDRTMLAAAIGLLPNNDDDVRQAAAKLDGVSVHMLRFAGPGAIDSGELAAMRDAYHLRGWKHVVSKANSKTADYNNTATDVWLVLDGTNVRGAVVLYQTPKSLTLATVAGNLSPVDLLHLRGHFGIPHFDGDGINGSQVN